MTQRTKRWALVALLVCVLCIAASIFVVATKATNNTSDKTAHTQDSKTESSSEEQSTNKADDKHPNQSASDSGNNEPTSNEYLSIKEWNVRFQLPPELRGDVTYEIQEMPGEGQVAHFEVGKIASLPGSTCKLSVPDGDGIGTYLRRSSIRTPQDEAPIHFFTNKIINGYFYTGGRIKYSDDCMTNESYRQQTMDTISDLTHSLAGLEAISR